jgi:hypothetical protein
MVHDLNTLLLVLVLGAGGLLLFVAIYVDVFGPLFRALKRKRLDHQVSGRSAGNRGG